MSSVSGSRRQRSRSCSAWRSPPAGSSRPAPRFARVGRAVKRAITAGGAARGSRLFREIRVHPLQQQVQRGVAQQPLAQGVLLAVVGRIVARRVRHATSCPRPLLDALSQRPPRLRSPRARRQAGAAASVERRLLHDEGLHVSRRGASLARVRSCRFPRGATGGPRHAPRPRLSPGIPRRPRLRHGPPRRLRGPSPADGRVALLPPR